MIVRCNQLLSRLEEVEHENMKPSQRLVILENDRLNQSSESQIMLQSETENISGEATVTSEQTEDLPIASQLINDQPVAMASDNSCQSE